MVLFNPLSDAMGVFLDIFYALPSPFLSFFGLSVFLLFLGWLFHIFH